jgi:hypothetical protein
MYDGAVHLDDEQDVVVLERHRVDTEEVGRQDTLGLRGEELGPGRSFSPWGWGEPATRKHGGDASLGHGDADLSQLAHASQVAPAGVLPGEAHDEFDSLSFK